MSHQGWEYNIVEMPGLSSNILKELDELGKDGWELVVARSGVSRQEREHWIFKRPLQINTLNDAEPTEWPVVPVLGKRFT
jgi:hypothetical protein